jgi:hypothetical protein
MLVASCSTGLIYSRTESDIRKQYTPTDAASIREMAIVNEFDDSESYVTVLQ